MNDKEYSAKKADDFETECDKRALIVARVQHAMKDPDFVEQTYKEALRHNRFLRRLSNAD